MQAGRRQRWVPLAPPLRLTATLAIAVATGDGIWGEPADRDGAIGVLRRAVELGINLIDTADSYGPDVSESLIAEALHPYPVDLVIATKAGLVRGGPGQWSSCSARARCAISASRT